MTPFIFIFICAIGFSTMPYTSARMRGRNVETYATRRRREAEYKIKQNIMHNIMLGERRENPVINIWQSDFINTQPDNNDFCMNLNSTWFHRIKNRGNRLHLSSEELQKIKDMYMQQVYTSYNFPNTWRDPNEWHDANGNTLQLRDITEEEITKYYFRRCPQPPITIGYVFSFIESFLTVFGCSLLLAAILGA